MKKTIFIISVFILTSFFCYSQDQRFIQLGDARSIAVKYYAPKKPEILFSLADLRKYYPDTYVCLHLVIFYYKQEFYELEKNDIVFLKLKNGRTIKLNCLFNAPLDFKQPCTAGMFNISKENWNELIKAEVSTLRIEKPEISLLYNIEIHKDFFQLIDANSSK